MILVVGGVLFLMLISLPFDFGRCFYPIHAGPISSGKVGHSGAAAARVSFAECEIPLLPSACLHAVKKTSPLNGAAVEPRGTSKRN